MEHLTKPEPPNVHAPRPSPRRRNRLRGLVHTWRWELFMWLLGTAGLIANAVLLIRFNGVQKRSWHSSVQITAFVAALAQLSQSALLVPIASSIGQLKWKWLQKDRKAIDVDRFDLASRGPDGALRLLLHLKMRPHLVSLGAVSTIFMLAFPTFIQQSVAINSRPFEYAAEYTASIKRASNATGSLPKIGAGLGVGLDAVAILQATLSDYANPTNVTGYCSTASCTWEPYKTLWICVTTKDITESLIPYSSTRGRRPDSSTGGGRFFSPQLREFVSESILEGTENVTLYAYAGLPVVDNNDGKNGPEFPKIAEVYIVFYG